MNVASTIGRSSGGPIGGYLSDTVGWRWWAFLVVGEYCDSILISFKVVPHPVPIRTRRHSFGCLEA